MGKIYDRLQKQLQVEEHREDAEDCIKIYNKLKEMNDGSVWSSDWQVLTTIGGWIGERPHAQMAYKPSKVGNILPRIRANSGTNSMTQYCQSLFRMNGIRFISLCPMR